MQARCVFAQGKPGLAESFGSARRELLSRRPVRNAFIADRSSLKAITPDPGLPSLREMAGGRNDIEWAARFLQLAQAPDTPDVLALDRAGAFRLAGEQGLIPEAAAERLAEAAILWQNLSGILQVVGESEFSAGTATDGVKAVVAQAGGESDFGALTGRIHQVAARVTSDLQAIDPILAATVPSSAPGLRGGIV